ncbi:MAG: glutathione S-transferase family protein [Hyphomonadaceae bacterium]|nr:glutathione S-transferase family protein [Hyphomonadaceae bacterium]
MHHVYGDLKSGNCYKVYLALHQLKQPFKWIDIDVLKKQTRTSEYLSLNPNGQIPLLITEDGASLPESNAILWYLGEGSALIPTDRMDRAQMLRWMFFEQYTHEPNVAVARFIVRYLGRPADREETLQQKIKGGYGAISVMEGHLARHDFFAANRYTLADIALYAYTHVAHEGLIELDAYPHVRAWLQRVKDQPDHAPME